MMELDLAVEERKSDFRGNGPLPSRKWSVQERQEQAFFDGIGKYPVLSIEEEKELVAKFKKTGSREIRDRLILSNMKFVISVASKYKKVTTASIFELANEGSIGLARAIEKYDPEKKVRLCTYASYWIKAHIKDYVIRNHGSVKVGTTQTERSLYYNLKPTLAIVRKQRGGDISQEELNREVAKRLGVSEEKVDEFRGRMGYCDISLNVPHRSGADWSELIPNKEVPPDEACIRKEACEKVREVFEEIMERYREAGDKRMVALLRDRVMPKNGKPKTLDVLGKRFKVTRERMRQLEKKILWEMEMEIKEVMSEDEIKNLVDSFSC